MGSHFSEDFKREVVAESYADDMSVGSVARRYEVSYSTIYHWRERYGHQINKDTQSIAASSCFIPVTVSPEQEPLSLLENEQAQSLDTWHVTISMGSDKRVEIDGAFDLPNLIKLLRGVSV